MSQLNSINQTQELDLPLISRRAGELSIITAGSFIILLIFLHFIKPELDPSWSMVSEYALGDYGLIMDLAFLLMGVSCFSLALALKSIVHSIPGKIGLFLIVVAGIGFVLAALFKTDPIITAPNELSNQGVIHSIGASLGGLLPVSALFIAWGLSKNPFWRSIKSVILWATAIILIAEIQMIISMMILLPENDGKLGPTVLIGWQNRIMIMAYALWLIMAGKALKNTSESVG
ncbi:MAG TPA: DUF998 domain-containing protein [Sphingobacteriaceae bacterium]